MNLHSILVKSIHVFSDADMFKYDNLHSILVKSIHTGETVYIHSRYIYIPFWLNLYKGKL